jgi:hypothetical protein
VSDVNPEEAFERELVDEAIQGIVGAAGSELASVIGVPVELTAQGVADVDVGGVAEDDDPVVVVLCRGGEPPLSIQLVVPREISGVLAGLQLGSPLEDLVDVGKQSLDPETLGALRGTLRPLVSAIELTLGERLEGQLQIQDALEVDEPASDPTWLVGTHFQRARLGVRIEGAEESYLDILFPPGSGSEPLPDVAGRQLGLLVDAETAGDADTLARLLGCPVEAIDRGRLERDGVALLAECDALLIPWEVDGRPGMDLLERLASHDSPVRPALLMTHEAPTRAIVRAALLAGASSFVMQPHVAAEVLERAGFLAGDADSAAGGEPEASVYEREELPHEEGNEDAAAGAGGEAAEQEE